MARIVCFVMCLLGLAAVASATEVHTVKTGETLSGISRQYYHDASQYIRIYQANKGKISLPRYWVYTGTTLLIPDAAATFRRVVTAEGPKSAVLNADSRAAKLDSYFAAHNMPLAGLGSKFVAEADANGIDWRLLAAISVKESYGGQHQLPGYHNPFGWASGRIKFESFNQAIEYISQKLGSGKYYRGKSVVGKLRVYNPPSVEPGYAGIVLHIMDSMQ